jgi:hypothetical protein
MLGFIVLDRPGKLHAPGHGIAGCCKIAAPAKGEP